MEEEEETEKEEPEKGEENAHDPDKTYLLFDANKLREDSKAALQHSKTSPEN